MAIEFQSIQSSGWTTASSHVVTKPVGTAVGDLLLLFFCSNGNINTLPSGFNAISTGTIPAAGGSKAIFTYYKIADSGDVAASNFTVTFTASIAGIVTMSRFTGQFAPASKWSWAGASTTNTASPSLNASITPNNRPNNMLLQFWCSSQVVTSLSGYAIATSNPTWTEIIDSYDAGIDNTIGIAYAVRPEQTATGNASVVGAGASGTSDWAVIQVAIAPAEVNITESATLTETIKYSFGRLVSEVVVLMENPNVLRVMWQNISKNVSSWINQIKNG